MTRIALINKTPPYTTSHGQESLDLALAGGSFGQDISLFFIEDGVWQLLPGQSPDNIEHKNYSKTFSALEFYDVENIYVCKQSLEIRGLSHADLCVEAEILTNEQLAEKLSLHQHCLSF